MKTTTMILAGAVVLIAVLIYQKWAQKNVGLESKETLVERLKSGAMVVDVRTPGEYQESHYPGAVNIPLDEVAARLTDFGNVDRSIVLYCRSGNRSQKAKAILETHGYKNIINAGGLSDMMSLVK